MILPKHRDLRLVTIRRGGTLTDLDHQRLALWAAACAEHVLNHFERARPGDERPRRAIELARAWARCEIACRLEPSRCLFARRAQISNSVWPSFSVNSSRIVLRVGSARALKMSPNRGE